MSLVIVDPGKGLIAADRRVCRGYNYTDTNRKILDLGDGYYFSAVGAAALDSIVCEWWEDLEIDGETPFQVALSLSVFLRQHCGGDIQGTVILVVPTDSEVEAWALDSDGAFSLIPDPSAFGSGADEAHVLLDSGVSVSTIFAAVAHRNASVSSGHDIVFF